MVDDKDVTGAFEEFVDERLEGARLTRGTLLRRGALAGAGLGALPILLSQVGPAMAASGQVAGGTALEALITAAQKEGVLNTITLPPTWANYGEIMSTFKSRYKVKLTDAIPDGTSAQENTAITSLKGSKRAPDVLDVGPSFAAVGKQQKIYLPYKNTNWATVPTNMKDPQGYWVGDYWGVISFGTNVDVAKTAPTDWADLLKNPAYKNMVALGGDPRQAGEAFAAVFAASLANGGSLDDITPGIQFFADLKKAGNFVTTQATSATKASGQTPIVCGWDYLQLADRDLDKGKVNVTVSVPKTGVFGNYYCQAINRYAPHPNAAKLWQEFLYSDPGQLLWLKGYTHPARFTDMANRKVIPAALLAKLPPAQDYKTVKFPTQAQSAAASKILADQWGPTVLGQ